MTVEYVLFRGLIQSRALLVGTFLSFGDLLNSPFVCDVPFNILVALKIRVLLFKAEQGLNMKMNRYATLSMWGSCCQPTAFTFSTKSSIIENGLNPVVI